jgi:hypothetical protein
VNFRRPAVLGLVLLAAACGGPATPSSSPLPVASASLAAGTQVPVVSPSAVAAGCHLDDAALVLPPDLADAHGFIETITSVGEPIVAQTHGELYIDTVTVWDPMTDARQQVVSRPPASEASPPTTQVSNFVGDADWIAWEESGFSLDEADWTMWAMDRDTGEVRKVATHETDAAGKAAPGWASDLSLAGSTLAWSSPTVGARGSVTRVWVADLASGTAKKLALDARFPSATSRDSLVALVATGSQGGRILAVPSTIPAGGGVPVPVAGFDPVRTLAFAASTRDAVVTRLIRAPTDSDPVTGADIEVGRDGVVTTYPLEVDWGPVAAGTGFVAWMDELHLWVLIDDAVAPVRLATIADPIENLRMSVAGPWIHWHTDASGDNPGIERLGHVTCPR